MATTPVRHIQTTMSFPSDGLFDFSNPTPSVIGTTPLETQVKPGQAVVVEGGIAVPLATQGGKIIGQPTWNATQVFVAQLYVDPSVTSRRNFGTNKDHEKDEPFLVLRSSIAATKINSEPMLVEATGETVTIQGAAYPRLRVRSGVRRYWALVDLQLPDALVRVLPSEMEQREQLLLSLLQNEMREPLPILDRCDVVNSLFREHGLKQHVIATRVGYSQSYVSRLCQAAEQPARIRTYLSAGSLSLDMVARLAEHIPNDEQLRTLVAQYTVQETLTGPQLKALTAELMVPEAAGGPVVILLPPERPGDVIVKRSLHTDVVAASPKAAKVTPYWKRGTPLRASPVRLLNHRHAVRMSGNADHPVVHVDTLQSRTFFRDLEKRRATTIDLESLEEALLSDLDAIREALERGIDADEESQHDASTFSKFGS